MPRQTPNSPPPPAGAGHRPARERRARPCLAPTVLALAVGELETNCYILWREAVPQPAKPAKSKKSARATGLPCAILDPGAEPERIIAEVEARGLVPALLLVTHGHGDHIGGLAALKAKWPAAVLVAPAGEEALLASPTRNVSLLFGRPVKAPPPEKLLADGEVIRLGGGKGGKGEPPAIELRFISLPGHTPAGGAYFVAAEGDAPPVLFSGDIVFAGGGIGRSDLPGGDGLLLVRGIREKLWLLPDATRVLPGHGPATTLGREKLLGAAGG